MKIIRKAFLVIIFISMFLSESFSLTIIKDLEQDYFSKLTNDQRDTIIGYGIMLDGKNNTMDNFTQSEQFELMALLDWNDTIYEDSIEELQDVTNLQGYNPISIFLRYEIIDNFNVKLDILKIDGLIKLFLKNNLTPDKSSSTLFSILYNFCIDVNKNAQFKVSFNNIYTMVSKLYNSSDIFNSLKIALQDDSVKNYILYGNTTKSGSYNSSDIKLIFDNLKKQFTSVDETKTNKMITILLQQGRDKNKVYSELYGILANFVNGYNGASKYKSIGESFNNIYKIVIKLANSSNLARSVLIVLNDNAVKDYFIK